MRLRSIDRAGASRHQAIYLATLLAVLVALCLPVAVTNAVNSEVGVTVCSGSSPPAEVQITEPNDDSVVSQSTIDLRGSVANASQIEIQVDGQYSSTLAVGAAQTTFETQVSLAVGTHTILVIANPICQGPNAQDSIVITYEPETQPSDGGSTPTDVGGGVVVGDGSEDDQNIETAGVRQIPIIGAAVGLVTDFSAFSGLDATIPANNTVVGVFRVALTIAALTLIVAASTVAPLFLQAFPGISELFNTNSSRRRAYVGWILRVGGVLLMGLVYFL